MYINVVHDICSYILKCVYVLFKITCESSHIRINKFSFQKSSWLHISYELVSCFFSLFRTLCKDYLYTLSGFFSSNSISSVFLVQSAHVSCLPLSSSSNCIKNVLEMLSCMNLTKAYSGFSSDRINLSLFLTKATLLVKLFLYFSPFAVSSSPLFGFFNPPLAFYSLTLLFISSMPKQWPFFDMHGT